MAQIIPFHALTCRNGDYVIRFDRVRPYGKPSIEECGVVCRKVDRAKRIAATLRNDSYVARVRVLLVEKNNGVITFTKIPT